MKAEPEEGLNREAIQVRYIFKSFENNA